MIIIGIDPGKSGGVAILDTESPGYLKSSKCPENPIKMSSIIAGATNSAYIEGHKLSVYIENVWAFPTDARSSAFKFGTNFGMWLGIIASHGITPKKVSPQTWMKGLQPLPKIRKERKLELKRLASDMFPEHRITLSTADAVMIAIWGAGNA